MNSLQKLLDFLTRLDEAAMTYTLEHSREDSITVLVSAPSERWEVEFFADGEVEVEVFYSNSAEEGLEDETALERLFAERDDELDEEEDAEDYEEEDDFEDDYDDEDYREDTYPTDEEEAR